MERGPRPSYYARVRASVHARAPRHAAKVLLGLLSLVTAAVVARATGVDLADLLRWLAPPP